MDSLTILALKKAESGGGGGDITVESLSVSQNGTYTATTGKAYSPVSVSVPQTTVSSLSVSENGTYTATAGTAYSPVTVNVPGGLVYETGTYTPAVDTVQPTITFQNQHSESPFFAMMVDATGTMDNTFFTSYAFYIVDWYRLTGHGIPRISSVDNYAFYRCDVRTNNESSITNTSTTMSHTSDETGENSTYPNFYVTKSEFKPVAGGNTDRYWRTGRTYKWIAVWKPTA